MALDAALAKLQELSAVSARLTAEAQGGSEAARELATQGGATKQDYEAFGRLLTQAANGIEVEANKIALGWRSMKTPEQEQSLLDAILKQIEAVVTCSFLVVSDGALCCSAARDESTQAVTNLLATCVNLLRFLREGHGEAEFSQQVPTYVGAVWEACKRVRMVAKTNRAAAKRVLLKSVLTIKDMHSEFTQLLNDHEEAGGAQKEEPDDHEDAMEQANGVTGADGADGEPQVGSDEWYEMMDDLQEGDSLDEEDAARLDLAVGMMAKSGRLVQLVTAAVGGAEAWTDAQGDVGYVAWLDSLTLGVASVERALGELGMRLYPPHDPFLIGQSSDVVKDRCAALAAAFQKASGRLPQEQVDQVQTVLSRLSEADLGE